VDEVVDLGHGEQRVLASGLSMTVADERRPGQERRPVRRERRRARRLRRLYALGGLAVLAAFLAATVVVVDMVH
jgi:hypothetical protein